jgi:excinuclease UvrABC helicase subunit UvrB
VCGFPAPYAVQARPKHVWAVLYRSCNTPGATELAGIIEEMTDRMRAAAADLQFEVAARLRDEVGELKKELRQMREAGLA